MLVLNKNFYVITGTILFVLFAIFSYESYYFFTKKQEYDNITAIRSDIIRSCEGRAKSLGFELLDDNKSNKVIAYTRDISNWEKVMYASSNLISDCKNMRMSEFCMGSSCNPDDNDALALNNSESNDFLGAYMVLNYKKEREVIKNISPK